MSSKDGKRRGQNEAEIKAKKQRADGDGSEDSKGKGPKTCAGQGGSCSTNAKKECVNAMCRSCCVISGNACEIHEYDGSLPAPKQGKGAKKCAGKSGKCPINAKKECVNEMCKVCCSTTGQPCDIHEYDGKSKVPVGGPKKCSGKAGKCITNAKKECTNGMCRLCCSTTGKVCNIHGFDVEYEPKPIGPPKCAGKSGRCVINAKKECINAMCKVCCSKTNTKCEIHRGQ